MLFCGRRHKLVFAIFLAVVATSALVASRLRFDPDVLHLLPTKDPAAARPDMIAEPPPEPRPRAEPMPPIRSCAARRARPIFTLSKKSEIFPLPVAKNRARLSSIGRMTLFDTNCCARLPCWARSSQYSRTARRAPSPNIIFSRRSASATIASLAACVGDQ